MTRTPRNRTSVALRQGSDELRVAKQAGLRYVTDALPGIRRVGPPGRFRYIEPSGKVLRDRNALERIRALAIPPAWTQACICPFETGHVQATGRDARGRKQYRYHARWREIRDANKYGQLSDFVRALPSIRKTVRRHLRLPGLPREKILAAAVKLLEATLIRIGSAHPMTSCVQLWLPSYGAARAGQYPADA